MPVTQWREVARIVGFCQETVRRVRLAAGETTVGTRGRCWFASVDEVQAWWRRVYLTHGAPTPVASFNPGRKGFPYRGGRKSDRARESAAAPLDVAELRREVGGK